MPIVIMPFILEIIMCSDHNFMSLLTKEIAFYVSLLWHLHLNYYGIRLKLLCICIVILHRNFMSLHRNSNRLLHFNCHVIYLAIIMTIFAPKLLWHSSANYATFKEIASQFKSHLPLEFPWHLHQNCCDINTGDYYVLAL
jgi:hypothetical protein